MPFNTLHVPDHLPAQTCQAINAMLHACLVQTCGVHPDDDFCLVSRYAEQDMMLHPTFLGCRDPSNTIVIEIVLLGGRTDEQKEAMQAPPGLTPPPATPALPVAPAVHQPASHMPPRMTSDPAILELRSELQILRREVDTLRKLIDASADKEPKQ